MTYVYPTSRTGTSQDLMTIITRAHEIRLERAPEPLLEKSAAQRLLLEPPFIGLGILMARLLELAPAERVLSFHDSLYAQLASPYRYVFDPQCAALSRAAELVRGLESRSGGPVALIALISHPPVAGEMAHLNFELVRHASLALRFLRGAPCRPRLVVAIDPFALDGIPIWKEGIYAGYMSRYHLGFDRLAFAQNPAVRCLLRGASWERMARRLLRLLNAAGEVGMVLAGGVPATTRVLYAVREWIGRQRRASPERGAPAEVLRRLRRFPDYARFESEGPHGARLRASAWRMMEAWAMSSVTGTFSQPASAGLSCADTGALTGEARATLERCLESLGLSLERRQAALGVLADEIIRETPYRIRFFEILAGRVLRKGRPLVFLPVAHRFQGDFGIEIKDAWSWEGFSQGRLRARRSSAESLDWEGDVAEFAVRFGKENFA